MGRRRRSGMARRGGRRRGYCRSSSCSENTVPEESLEPVPDVDIENSSPTSPSSEPAHEMASPPSIIIANYSNRNSMIEDIFPVSMVPDVDGEDVILNRRGTPIRTKNFNRTYYHNEKRLILSPSFLKKGCYVGGIAANTTTSSSKRTSQGMDELNAKQAPRTETRRKRRNSNSESSSSDFRLPQDQDKIGVVPSISSIGKLKKIKKIADSPRPFRRIPEPKPDASSDEQLENQKKLTGSKSLLPPPQVLKSSEAAVKKRTRDRGASVTTKASQLPTVLNLSTNEVKLEPKTKSPPSVLPFPLMSEHDRSLMMNSTGLMNYSPSLQNQCHTFSNSLVSSSAASESEVTTLFSSSNSKLHRQSSKQYTPEQERNDQFQDQEDFYKNKLKLKQAQSAKEISERLRNVVKLPKAHRWICFEWFYGDVDRALLEGESDFQLCLKESFPRLTTRRLTRAEWCFIRRTMGRPRRCSQSFFKEEREELERKRNKMRMIQRRSKLPENWTFSDLPDNIPLSIRIGTKVTARVRSPQDGIFNGVVQGVDLSDNTYRIRFDRNEIGSRSVIDYEVMSLEPPDTFPVASHTMKLIRHGGSVASDQLGGYLFENSHLRSETMKGIPRSLFPSGGMLGGFPVRLLEVIVRFSKILREKRDKNLKLATLNVEAEKAKAYGQPYSKEFQMRYAKCVVDLDGINETINLFLNVIQSYFRELPQIKENSNSAKLLDVNGISAVANIEAALILSTYNNRASGINNPRVRTPKVVSLVEQMASLMLHIRELSIQSGDRKPFELIKLQESVQKMKMSLEGSNLQVFQNKIEIPMKRIIAGLCLSTKQPTNEIPHRFCRTNM